MAAAQLTFGEAELTAEMPSVVRAMNDYIEGFCVPIIKRHEDYGEAWGTGSFLKRNRHEASTSRSRDSSAIQPGMS